LPARSWAGSTRSLLWTAGMLTVIAVLAGSGADKAAVVQPDRVDLARDGAGLRPYGSLSNTVPSIPACPAAQACVALNADRDGGAQ
jgi:hypothetical protein